MASKLWLHFWRAWFMAACASVVWCFERGFPGWMVNGVGWVTGTRYAFTMCCLFGACPIFPSPADKAASKPPGTPPQPMQGSPKGAEPVPSRRADGRSCNHIDATDIGLGSATGAARAARRSGGVPKLVTGTHKDRIHRSLPNGGRHA